MSQDQEEAAEWPADHEEASMAEAEEAETATAATAASVSARAASVRRTAGSFDEGAFRAQIVTDHR